MTANRSLDEFADAETGEAADERGTSDGTDEDVDSTATETDDDATPTDVSTAPATASTPSSDDGAGTEVAEPDRPESTYVWSPDGGPCGTCGESVEERWRDGDGLVCAGCKEW